MLSTKSLKTASKLQKIKFTRGPYSVILLFICLWLAAAILSHSDTGNFPFFLWLPLGIYLGFTLITKVQYWPILAFAMLAADLIRLGDSHSAINYIGWICDTITVFLSVAILRKLNGTGKIFEPEFNVKTLVWMSFTAPAIFATTQFISTYGLDKSQGLEWLRLFFGGGLAVLVATPPVLVFYQMLVKPKENATKRVLRSQSLTVLKDGPLILGFSLIAVGLFNTTFMSPPFQTVLFIYPVFAFIALQGRIETTILAVAIFGIIANHYDNSIIFGPNISERFLLLRSQIVTCITAFSHLLLTLVVAQKQASVKIIKQQSNFLQKSNNELKQEVLKRIEAENSAMKASAAKGEFLAAMSHEIRSPLSAILGFAELLASDHELPANSKSSLAIIVNNGQHLNELVNQVLDLSKVEAGKLKVHRAPFTTQKLFSNVIDLMRIKAKQKGLTLNLEINPNTPIHMESDELRIRQILINAIGNAIKFTNIGHVDVTVDVETRSDQDLFLKIEISDTGIGISESDKKRLFKNYNQGSNNPFNKYGGTGLGLSLSRKLAILLGGEFRLIHSQENAGSTFCFTVKVKDATKKPMTNLKTSDVIKDLKSNQLSGFSVLIADDAPELRLLTAKILESYGATVDIASDGDEAVEKALLNHYDIVLLDHQMVRLNGPDAAKELRRYGYQRPLIAVTGSAMEQDIETSINSGFDGHFSKPINWPQLVDKICELRP